MLRVSDLFKLKPINFNKSTKELVIWQEKTKKKITIPISDHMYDYMESIAFKIPILSNQKYNDYLKELGEEAGITEQVEHIKYIGNKKVVSIINKYEMITSHTARRTGITLLLLAGIQPEVIQKISGHEDIRTLMKYVRIDEQKAVSIIRNAWNDR